MVIPIKDGEVLPTLTRMKVPPSGAPFAGEAADGLSCGPTSGVLRWFAVYTTCRHEKRVAEHFSSRTIDHHLPLYRSERKWRDGSRITLDLPLFPGYIFAHIDPRERVRVLSVPGVLAIVGGTGGDPAPLPDAEIEAIRLGIEQRRVEPHPLLTAGARARIRKGAFAGMEGVVLRHKNSFRVVLTLELIMHSIAVEVDACDLEPIGEPAGNPARPGALTLAPGAAFAPFICLQGA
jgi:transcription antitermination factor NusG